MSQLPSTRQFKKLSEIAFVKSGKRLPKGFFVQDKQTNYPYIRVSDFGEDGTIDATNIKYITHDVFNQISKYIITDQDLYISIAGTIGKTGIIPSFLNGASLTENAVRLVYKNPENINNKYILYYTKSPLFAEQAGLATRAVAMPKLAINRLENIEIPLPPLPTQHTIVARLDEASANINAAKSAIQDQIDALDILWQSCLSSAMNNNIGELVKLGTLCDFVRGPFGGSLKKEIFKPSGYAIYEQQHAIYNQFEDIRYFVNEDKFNEMKRFELKEGDLIMSCSGTMGKIAIVPNGIKKGIINQALLKLTPSGKIYNKFLKLLMQSESFQNGLNEFSQGAAIQNVASVAILKQILIPLPSLPEQQQIVADLDELSQTINNLKTVYKSQLAEYDALRASILDKAFRGELVS